MPDKLIHKLIVPSEGIGLLNELILCWKHNGAPAQSQIRRTDISTNINDVNCPDCWKLWIAGIYY